MKQVNIAILGLGTVGGGTYRVIEAERARIEHKEGLSLNVKKVLALNYSVDIPEEKKAKDIDEIVNDPDISVVVELMGGKEPAKTFMLKALNAGKSVVSANKELISQAWPELESAAKATGAGFYFEASVGGGIPILRTVEESLQANEIDSIMAIINGTTNYILTKMSDEGRDFDEVLSEAQRLGYAEANPTSDIDGFDAMYKLSILASMAFHVRLPIEFIHREGIRKITKQDIDFARELGLVVKLLAIGKKDGELVEVRVHPTMIPADHPLANVKGSFNAILLHGSSVDDVMFYGRGAGDLPTASAVVSDIIFASKQSKHAYMTFMNEKDKISPTLLVDHDWLSGYFIRLTVHDEPGVFARVANIFSNNGVSLKSVLQKGEGGDKVPLIFVTHLSKELSVKKSLEQIANLPEVHEVANCIRVEY